MKKNVIPIFLILLSSAIKAQTDIQPAGLKVGDKAPMFSAKDNNGNLVSLEKQLEKGRCGGNVLPWSMVPFL